MKLMIKLSISLLTLAISIYFYIDSLNQIISLRLKIPETEKQLAELKAENTHLQYEIDQFESPMHLMELAKKPEFSHLKSANLHEIIQYETDEP